ncbi:MAG TPA: 1-(5-phosphoribosyl)-5-[(5-phosphoribosylamino)methylideneamino]imidazole-4-carboxamide isomerase [archaeon]|nr:1-(5-phosphoribosyl)-5-[(5-phosphoribosylamino)methylideneamino]imidazole-4-carboxamide isomerase [archaeon]
MDIIPAIDLMGGRAVRLRQGKKSERTTYFDDPVEPALAFVTEGARYLHVVDLDGAFEGQSKNLAVVRRIVEAVGSQVCLQLGGGIRNSEGIERALGLGVDRVILGTAILADPKLLRSAVIRFGSERIVVGLDAVGGKVAIRGWKEVTSREAGELAREVAASGAGRIIYTDISTDGMLSGPNIPALVRIAVCGLAVIASGGIASLEHVRAVAALEPRGVEAVIIGKALYEGKIKLKEAIRAAR